MLWLRYAGARRRQSETQAGREVPVVGDADAKELQSGGSGLSEGGHRAQVRLPGLAAHLRGDVARARWCVPVQRIHRASRHAASGRRSFNRFGVTRPQQKLSALRGLFRRWLSGV